MQFPQTSLARDGSGIRQLYPRVRGDTDICRRGSGVVRAGEVAPHIRFTKTGPETSRIELANAGQLTVNRAHYKRNTSWRQTHLAHPRLSGPCLGKWQDAAGNRG